MLAEDKIGVVGDETEVSDGDDGAKDEPVVAVGRRRDQLGTEGGQRANSRLEVSQTSESYPN